MDAKHPPRVHDAPGLTWKPRKFGWEARWHARTDLVRRGYYHKSQGLWRSTEQNPDPNPSQIAYIQDICQANQDDMLAWAHAHEVPKVGTLYDGTIASLVECYKNDPDSRYQKLRHNTREGYNHQLRRLARDHGLTSIKDINARLVKRWHEAWSADGRVAMGHSMVGILRTILGYGATLLEILPEKNPCAECERLCAVLSKMDFPLLSPRTERITAEQVAALRAEAHKAGLHSMALAQAFQFDLMLRQKDVIGEWVPVTEPGTSDVIAANLKWLRGLRWSEIGTNLILRHVTSKRQKIIEVDLNLAPMVLEELKLIGKELPASGPIIVSEITGLPWTNYEFRRKWRPLARAAGIPDEVKNMDSRAGGISEATDAGADLEMVRHAATHSNISMTQKYSRGAAEKTAKVMEMRRDHRERGANKKAKTDGERS